MKNDKKFVRGGFAKVAQYYNTRLIILSTRSLNPATSPGREKVTKRFLEEDVHRWHSGRTFDLKS